MPFKFDYFELTLWYGSLLVAKISRASQSDGTWDGNSDLQLSQADGRLARQLLDFIHFCEDWNERVKEGPDSPDANEFDAFADILRSGMWLTKDAEGNVAHIREAPVFFHGNQISWILEHKL
jgi:hypothetical protein